MQRKFPMPISSRYQRMSPEAKEAGRIRQQIFRQQRISAGLCLRCKTPSSDGSQFCETHRRIANAQGVEHANRNREKRRAYWREHGKKHAAKKLAYAKEYAKTHKEKIAAYKRSIRSIVNERNKLPEHRAKVNKRRRERKRIDPGWAMADRLRKRIGRAIRDRAKARK